MRMRVALTQGTKESYRECYNWQFINCLELWARVISAHRDKPELRPLIYPVTQVRVRASRGLQVRSRVET